MVNILPLTFKQWVESHNPQEQWEWDDPAMLADQLATTIGETGHIQLRKLFWMLYDKGISGLTHEQNQPFIRQIY